VDSSGHAYFYNASTDESIWEESWAEYQQNLQASASTSQYEAEDKFQRMLTTPEGQEALRAEVARLADEEARGERSIEVKSNVVEDLKNATLSTVAGGLGIIPKTVRDKVGIGDLPYRESGEQNGSSSEGESSSDEESSESDIEGGDGSDSSSSDSSDSSDSDSDDEPPPNLLVRMIDKVQPVYDRTVNGVLDKIYSAPPVAAFFTAADAAHLALVGDGASKARGESAVEYVRVKRARERSERASEASG
jgi:hypothetical protein